MERSCKQLSKPVSHGTLFRPLSCCCLAGQAILGEGEARPFGWVNQPSPPPPTPPKLPCRVSSYTLRA